MARILHVAALPFPSAQGTQTLLHHMLSAHGAAGHDAQLLCYAHGDGREVPYPVHRLRDFPKTRSLRSGPSWQKPLLDASLAMSLQRLTRRLRPDLVIAHHVEAASCAAAVLSDKWLFYAHTDLAAELPTYFDPLMAGPLERAGGYLDRWLVRRAPRVCAVSEGLARRLSQDSGRRVAVPPLPWPVASPITRREQAQARSALGLVPGDEVVLYAGNLDTYQGLDTWLSALRLLCPRRPRLRWLLASAGDTSALCQRLCELGLRDRVVVVDLSESRRQAYAAADLAIVPRQTPGGLPVKLLEALACGLPVVAVKRAALGLPLGELAWLVDGEPLDFVEGVVAALEDPAERIRRRKLGRAYLGLRHAFQGWVEHPALALS